MERAERQPINWRTILGWIITIVALVGLFHSTSILHVFIWLALFGVGYVLV